MTQPAYPPLRLGVVGAGGFARFLAESTASLPTVRITAVTDPQPGAAERLTSVYDGRVHSSWADLLADDEVDVVVVATPPADHAVIAAGALEAGKHVFCEKPLALDTETADRLVETTERTGLVLVVDHVLRYNPILRALTRLRDEGLLQPVQRFCFENDASDEDLHPDHWFWDETRSGGIFVEHGVHFFDAATMLIGREADSVQAVAARRPDGPVDLVSVSCTHGGSVLATHTHSFTHAHRCERQLMRLDAGPAEIRVEGWIPVRALLDLWTDSAGAEAAEALPQRMTELLAVDGFRLGDGTAVTVEVERDAGTSAARGRGLPLDIPHHARIELSLGGHPAKPYAYAESVRAAMTDLVRCVTHGGRPVSGVLEGADAVAVASAATSSARDGQRKVVTGATTQRSRASLHS